MEGLTDEEISCWLRESSTIAVIGCSDRPDRTSYRIAGHLQRAGYRILPVNPNIESTLGEKSYDSILTLPEKLKVDIINIFRNKKFTDKMMDQITQWSEQRGRKPLVWTQPGVSTEIAGKRADEYQIPYVANRCIMVEYSKLGAGRGGS
ncbi:MAG: CoA-binding protein [Balneolaceae bacterium]